MFLRTMIFGSPWTHEGFLVIAAYLSLFAASKKIGNFKGLERAFDTVIIISFVACILQGIYGSLVYAPGIKSIMPDMKYEIIRYPFYATLGNPNHLGLFSALFFPYTYCKRKWILLTLVMFMLVTAQSRGAWISVFITALIMERRAVVVASAIFIFLAAPFYRSTIARISHSEIHFPVRDSDVSSRAYIWKRSIPLMKRTLIIGKGPGTFGLYFPQHESRGTKMWGNEIVDRPHNMYINTWTTLGLIPLILMLMAFSKIIINGSDNGYVMGCVGFLLCGLTTDSVLCVTPYFIIFLGLLAHKGGHNEHNEKRRHGEGTGTTNQLAWGDSVSTIDALLPNTRSGWENPLS